MRIVGRSREDNSWVSVYRTETIFKNLNPRWKPFTIKAQKLCNGDFDRPLKVVCFDWVRSEVYSNSRASQVEGLLSTDLLNDW